MLQSMETSLERHREVHERSFAGQQVSAAFDFAQRLVRAKNLQEKALLQQQQFVQGSGRARALDLADAATETVKAATSRDRAHFINTAHCA